jgi:hypothetical protein
MKKIAVFLLIVAVYALHQDFWNWSAYKPLAFGFLPVGLWYQGLYAIICAVLFWILGKTVWPTHLEAIEGQYQDTPNRGGGH